MFSLISKALLFIVTRFLAGVLRLREKRIAYKAFILFYFQHKSLTLIFLELLAQPWLLLVSVRHLLQPNHLN
jgi:hypothetical protein